MHILIIGGTKYMGRLVVQKLLERGDRVTLFSRGNTRPEWWDQITHIQGDRTDRKDFQQKLKNKSFDAVIDTQAFCKEDVESTESALRGRTDRYLFVSTGSVYMDGKLDFFTHCPFKESDVEWSSLDYTYPEGELAYGVGKRHCEKWLQENSKIPYTIIRIPAVMGWNDPTSRMWWWVQRALDSGDLVLPLEHRAPFRTLYAADAADNFIRAINAPKAANQTCHIATQEVFTNERWADLIWKAAGHKSEITYVPQSILNAQLSEYSPPLTRSLPYIHDLSKAVHDFGFCTTPAETWIQTTVDWYRNQYQGEDSKGYDHRQAELALAEAWRKQVGDLVSNFSMA
ncbi:MAG: NAD-dependent epimerase/dehydratase family protein [bacterium]|nr:NAD-dependent epimerase/dehydratase family protein [bacterium]